ncbi:hypothetical protein ACIOHO_40815 [Streptomyces sp. NPDC087849]|uniref:hypothetical protein n=1 Tax=Streptomyces sp. NPDC087849 TaxID=3365808 RepID=UPI00382ECCCD
MSSSRARPDHPVLLPASAGWRADARLVGEALATVASCASGTFDDTRYLVPALTWQISADLVNDCATSDHLDAVRVLTLPAYALDAVWACHAALLRAATNDDDSACLADLLSYYLGSVHSTDLHALTGALQRTLAVLTLDLPAARALMTYLVLGHGTTPSAREAHSEVLAAWRGAGIIC